MASSTMRLSGLISGMDTESIIQQLVSAKQTKVDDAKKAQTKQEWKQTAWKELNTKIKNLQSKFVNNMRFESAYSKRVTKVSDSNAVSVITGDGAMTGVQNLKVSQLAKTAYMTGGKLTLKDNVTADTKLNALTKLSDLGIKGSDGSTVAGITTGDDTTLKIKNGDTSVELNITKDTTISDVLSKLKEAGLNANFDTTQQRFYISAKDSGDAGNFSITATGTGADDLLKGLGITDANYIKGQDSVITLNNTEYTSNSNVFSINGLTITALKETGADEEITLTTQDDVDGIYDMIKSFLKEYNTLINEMDKLYNADSARGYEPLTDDEKDAMSDTEVEKYETKIKDALLRRDSNLSTVSSTLKEVMSSGLEVNGKKILVDCGLQQGRDEIDNAALPFHPGSIDVVLVTHAHIDHSGRIPMRIKNGTQGRITTNFSHPHPAADSGPAGHHGAGLRPHPGAGRGVPEPQEQAGRPSGGAAHLHRGRRHAGAGVYPALRVRPEGAGHRRRDGGVHRCGTPAGLRQHQADVP